MMGSVLECPLQYFLPFATDGINYHIEQAILRANRLGVKVISLAALNKVGFLSFFLFFSFKFFYLFFYLSLMLIFFSQETES